jgi:hypothetical protein
VKKLSESTEGKILKAQKLPLSSQGQFLTFLVFFWSFEGEFLKAQKLPLPSQGHFLIFFKSFLGLQDESSSWKSSQGLLVDSTDSERTE